MNTAQPTEAQVAFVPPPLDNVSKTTQEPNAKAPKPRHSTAEVGGTKESVILAKEQLLKDQLIDAKPMLKAAEQKFGPLLNELRRVMRKTQGKKDKGFYTWVRVNLEIPPTTAKRWMRRHCQSVHALKVGPVGPKSGANQVVVCHELPSAEAPSEQKSQKATTSLKLAQPLHDHSAQS